MKKFTKNIKCFLLIFSLILCECKKTCTNCDKCTDFSTNNPVLNFSSNQSSGPCFNPLNANEFVYVKKENGIISLVKYDLVSKSETIIKKNIAVVDQPKWGINGLMVFSSIDLHLYLIKNNGDSLRRITNYGQNTDPSFLLSDRIFYGVGAATSPGIAGNKIIDYNGKMIDSIRAIDIGGTLGSNDINFFGEIATWKKESNNMFSVGYFTKIPIDYKELLIFDYKKYMSITCFFWHPNGIDLFFSSPLGIYKINKSTKKVTQLRNACATRSYVNISISNDGQKILAERADAVNFNEVNNSWDVFTGIYLMNIDGSDEVKLF